MKKMNTKKMRKKELLFPFLIISIFMHSQTFDFEYKYRYARSLSNKNADSSEIVLDQIIENAQREKQFNYVSKAYYLKAFNSYLKSDAKSTLDFAEKALSISEQNNYPVGKALAYRMQGTQYAKLGLLKEASKSLTAAIAEVQTDTSDEGHELKGMIYNSFLITLNQREYKKKEYYSVLAVKEYQKIKNITRKNELLVSAYSNLGYNLSEVKKFNESKYFFRKALALVGNDHYYLRCNILHDIGFSFSEQNRPDSAASYFQKALKIAEDHHFNEKKIEIAENLEKTYSKLNDRSNASKYKLEHLKLKDSIRYNQKMAVNKMLSRKEEIFVKTLNKNTAIFKVLMFVSFILALIVAIGIFKIVQFRKKQKMMKTVSADENLAESAEDIQINETKISPEVEQNILNGLKNFEESLHFNNKNISRYNLSNDLNVNTKYLSLVIKKHKNLNFNQYINHLRINYIADRLKNDPQYRKYKINHLSEITGYSSHSAFSVEFKKIIGTHPSAFIKTLDSSVTAL